MSSEVERLRALLALAMDHLAPHQLIMEWNNKAICWQCRKYEEGDSMTGCVESPSYDVLVEIKAALDAPLPPVYTQFARLDTMWQQLLRERDEAKQEARQAKATTSAAFQRGVETFRQHMLAFALGATSYGKPPDEAQVILDELPRMQVDDPEAK